MFAIESPTLKQPLRLINNLNPQELLSPDIALVIERRNPVGTIHNENSNQHAGYESFREHEQWQIL